MVFYLKNKSKEFKNYGKIRLNNLSNANKRLIQLQRIIS